VNTVCDNLTAALRSPTLPLLHISGFLTDARCHRRASEAAHGHKGCCRLVGKKHSLICTVRKEHGLIIAAGLYADLRGPFLHLLHHTSFYESVSGCAISNPGSHHYCNHFLHNMLHHDIRSSLFSCRGWHSTTNSTCHGLVTNWHYGDHQECWTDRLAVFGTFV
jgi:hypothetical protein